MKSSWIKKLKTQITAGSLCRRVKSEDTVVNDVPFTLEKKVAYFKELF